MFFSLGLFLFLCIFLFFLVEYICGHGTTAMFLPCILGSWLCLICFCIYGQWSFLFGCHGIPEMRKFHLFQGATQIIPMFSPCRSMYYLDISTTNPLSHRDGNGSISRAQELTQKSSAMSDPRHWETRPIISMNLLKKANWHDQGFHICLSCLDNIIHSMKYE